MVRTVPGSTRPAAISFLRSDVASAMSALCTAVHGATFEVRSGSHSGSASALLSAWLANDQLNAIKLEQPSNSKERRLSIMLPLFADICQMTGPIKPRLHPKEGVDKSEPSP